MITPTLIFPSADVTKPCHANKLDQQRYGRDKTTQKIQRDANQESFRRKDENNKIKIKIKIIKRSTAF